MLAGLRFVVNMANSPVAMVVEVEVARLAAIGIPTEHEAPSLIDADRVDALQVAFQLLETKKSRNQRCRKLTITRAAFLDPVPVYRPTVHEKVG